MYETHFGLTAAPFRLTPDPGFYFGSRGHSQALSVLVFGAHQREGFMLLTGEAGVGKTTVVHTLLQGLAEDEVVSAQIAHTQLDDAELLAAICCACGVGAAGRSRADLLAALEAFFITVAAAGRRTLLVVDEAHNLGERELEALRLLSNFQLGHHPLLQAVLVGAPALRERLGSSAALAPLRERVIAACHLGPLTLVETMSYIHHRMQLAGWQGAPVFDEPAVAQVFHVTRGNPRRINQLCARLLMAAFVESRTRVDAAQVERLAGELEGLPAMPAVPALRRAGRWP